MSEGEIEILEAEIITVVYAQPGGYAHAESVLHRLQSLAAEVGHEAAVRQLHTEIVVNR
jgi:hypothetical protein